MEYTVEIEEYIDIYILYDINYNDVDYPIFGIIMICRIT
jgi:hypothetical protein